MISSVGKHFDAPDTSSRRPMIHHGTTFVRRRPSDPPATTEVGQLLDLGLALGHDRFELVSLAGREEAGMVAAHAWADCVGNNSREDPRPSTTVSIMQPHDASTPRSRPRLPVRHDSLRVQARREELLREVEWLRERVENLSRELVLARKDSSRLAKQLKQEEGLGREQRRKADDAVREAKALREELNRLKDDRSVNGSASRAALSDAHSRIVRMAERRRRQQAESLMQAYKGLYEDQLQTQHASAESYRSLTRGYSRLSADNKALRRETTSALAAIAAAASDAAGDATDAVASPADMQQTTGASLPLLNSAVQLSRDEASRSGRTERWEKAREDRLDGALAPPYRNRAAALPTARSLGGTASVLDTDRNSNVVETASTREYGSATAESAAAVATAAIAVAEAAGTLAEAATQASSTYSNAGAEAGPADVTSPVSSSFAKSDVKERAAAERQARDGAKINPGTGGVVVEKCGRRDRTTVNSSAAETNCPSTTETFACSPCSDDVDGPSLNAEMGPVTAPGGERQDGLTNFPADGWAPPAGCCLGREGVRSKSRAVAGGGAVKGYAFPQTTREEERFSTGPNSARMQGAAALENRGGRGGSDVCIFDQEARSTSEHPSLREKKENARPTKGVILAVPPVEPAPCWRGRPAAPGRLLVSSTSWANAADVNAPKRSTSPTTPRRGRWGNCVGGGILGAGKGTAQEDGCIRIEPFHRTRPHSI